MDPDNLDNGGLLGRSAFLIPDPHVPPLPIVPVTNVTNMTLGNSVMSSAVPLKNSEIISLVFIGIIGTVGTVMNTGVLAVVHTGRLVKKDYRMLYYIFITVGDLLFAIHSVINALSIWYRDLYMFKIFAVCLNLHVTIGVVSYQWSAMCIVLLIIDLIWSLIRPFGDDKPKKMFSKVGCIVAFISGVSFALIPFAFWNDSPRELEFCSIANVYGTHWNEYQIEAVTMLSFFFLMMLGASAVLIYTIYSTHRTEQIRDIRGNVDMAQGRESDIAQHSKGDIIKHEEGDVDKARPVMLPKVSDQIPDLVQADCHSPHPTKRFKVSNTNLDPANTVNKRHSREEIVTAVAVVAEMDHVTDNANYLRSQGVDNKAFVTDEVDSGTSVHVLTTQTEPKAAAREVYSNTDYDNEAHESKSDVQRKEFYAACRNVCAFMATYVGSCLPYYIYLLATIDCAPTCYQDTPGQRVIRVVVATFLYLLPILDPILYTQRFAIFKEAALEAVKPCFRCLQRDNDDDQ